MCLWYLTRAFQSLEDLVLEKRRMLLHDSALMGIQLLVASHAPHGPTALQLLENMKPLWT